MGYYVAILRSEDTESAETNPIGREEWLACVTDDAEMRVLPAGRCRGDPISACRSRATRSGGPAYRRSIRRESIGINADGPVSLDYHDGDLFWGHTIVVRMSEDRTFS